MVSSLSHIKKKMVSKLENMARFPNWGSILNPEINWSCLGFETIYPPATQPGSSKLSRSSICFYWQLELSIAAFNSHRVVQLILVVKQFEPRHRTSLFWMPHKDLDPMANRALASLSRLRLLCMSHLRLGNRSLVPQAFCSHHVFMGGGEVGCDNVLWL